LTHPFKLKKVAKLCAGSGEVMIIPTQFYGHEPHQSLDNTHELIQQIQARYDQRKAIRWGITLQSEDRLIGSCGFHHFDESFHRAETGYELHRTF